MLEVFASENLTLVDISVEDDFEVKKTANIASLGSRGFNL